MKSAILSAFPRDRTVPKAVNGQNIPSVFLEKSKQANVTLQITV